MMQHTIFSSKQMFSSSHTGSAWALLAMSFLGYASQAEMYWAKAAASGKTPPDCFVWYADEAGTQAATVTPKANDGNTYVVLGSSKMTGNYTAPAGTTWYFGADGKTIGTKSTRPSFGTNGGVTLNFGDCTIFGLRAQPNSSGNLSWAGNNTLVKTDQAIEYSVQNAESAVPRGINLSGSFHGTEDVVVNFTRGGSAVGGRSNYILSGDFTDYRGKFTASNGDASKVAWLSLKGDSAFGDSSIACTDYIRLDSFTTLEIAPNVTQYATKGIKLNLTANQTNFLYAAEATPWTLTAPLSGTVGTLAKTGEGNLTLATSVAIGKISVKEGTLVIDSAASFAAGTQMYVWPGAQVVSRVGLNIPNVTVTVAEGGGFSFDFTAPYDGTHVTTLDMSTLPATDWEALSKPVPVQLSQAIVQPFSTTNRFAVAKFPSTLGVTAEDFRDATPKTYGLPNTTFEVASDGNGYDVLTLVASPVIHLAVTRDELGAAARLLEATQTPKAGGDPLPVWSDGQTPHAGADYVVATDVAMVTADGWQSKGSRFEFPGDSLTLVAGDVHPKTETNTFKRLIVHNGVKFVADGFGLGDTRHVIAGDVELVSGTVRFTGNKGESGGTPYRSHFDIAATMHGAGILCFDGDSGGYNPVFSGSGQDFDGTVRLEMTATESTRTALETADILSLVADRAQADPRALLLVNTYNGLWLTEDSVLEGVNYGLATQGAADYLGVAEGKTLTLNGNLRMQSALLHKYGAGTLSLGGQILYTYDGKVNPKDATSFDPVLAVGEGWVMPYAWNNAKSYRYLNLRFTSNDAGLAIDTQTADAHIAKYGLCLYNDDPIRFGNANVKLNVKLLLSDEDVTKNGSYPVLTVKDDVAEKIKDRIAVLKNFTGASATVAAVPADGLDGFTTLVVNLQATGLVILFK